MAQDSELLEVLDSVPDDLKYTSSNNKGGKSAGNLPSGRLSPVFVHLGEYVGPVIECQPVKSVVEPVKLRVEPLKSNFQLPLSTESLPPIRLKKVCPIVACPKMNSKPKKVIKSGKGRVEGLLKVPDNNLLPKKVIPKQWSEASLAKKMRKISCQISSESSFAQAGSGGFSQHEREKYDIEKKYKAIQVFVNKPTYHQETGVKSFEKF